MYGYEERLTDMFSQALKDEFTSAIIYLKMAHALRGVDACPIATELVVHGKEEFDHGNMVIEYCANHGIDGDIDYEVDLDRINSSPEDLAEVLLETQKLEKDAIELYNKIAQLAQKNGDLETRKFAQGLMIIEQGHFDDLAKFTNQTRGFMKGIAAQPVEATGDTDGPADIIAIPLP